MSGSPDKDYVERAVQNAIQKLVKEGERTIDVDEGNVRVSIDISRRQISISVYTREEIPALPLPKIGEEIVSIVYDTFEHKFVRFVGTDRMKSMVRELYLFYKMGGLSTKKERG